MNVDELRRALDVAEARTTRWKRGEDAAFWACMLSSGALFSDHLWLRAVSALAFSAWVLTLLVHSYALRAELRAHARWVTAFYRERGL